MTPRGPGRHCAACQKTVVDFTRKTDAEILAYLREPGQASSCGRFRPSQVSPPVRLLTLRAAPWLALSVAAVLTLTHCTPDPSTFSSVAPEANAAQGTQVVRGRVLDRDTQQPLAGALVICEADTLCQTRTGTDGSFVLAVPLHLASSKLIAAVTQRPKQDGEDWLMPYIPHYFTAHNGVTVLLRQSPMVLGQPKLEPGETHNPIIAAYMIRHGALPPPPPPPQLTSIKFTAPVVKHSRR